MKFHHLVMILAMLLLALPAAASDKIENFSPIDRDYVSPQKPEPVDDASRIQTPDNPSIWWQGELRVYVVEHTSSMGWRDADGFLYEFPFLAFAINSTISVDQITWDTTVTWDGYDYDYDGLQEDNLAVQAVLFSQADGYPEAAAMANPGVPGSNTSTSGNTHTVFAEEGTATW